MRGDAIMTEDLRANGDLISQFRDVVINCNIDKVPKFVRELLQAEAWRSFIVAFTPCENRSFLEFIRDRPVKGCGWDPKMVAARQCGYPLSCW
jgi:hypothetical protein